MMLEQNITTLNGGQKKTKSADGLNNNRQMRAFFLWASAKIIDSKLDRVIHFVRHSFPGAVLDGFVRECV